MSKASTIGSSTSRSSAATANANQTPSTTFIRAVVVELLNDPSYYTDDELLEKFNNIANPGVLTGNPQKPPFSEEAGDPIESLRYLIPRNSLLVKIVNAGAAKAEDKSTLCFPFFPPYLQFPVKPGEQVWVVSERPTQEMIYLYWMCRITGPGFVDDINYTHLDRQILPAPTAVTASFPNGDGTPAHFTLPNVDDYDTIVNDSTSGLSFNPEPVPRLSRRPGDLVLQGSNNTLILMSDDRGWGADEDPAGSETSNASKTEEEIEKILAGSIDVVAGRGRFLTEPEVDADPVGTSPIVIENAREEQETGKYFINPIEGDPDFVNDSSRVYVSMNTSGDEKFGLTESETIPTPFDGAYEPHNDQPYVILKSDNIRIIARKNEEADPEINGSIRIVKEGAPDDDLATIMITPEGNVQISGKQIFIGRVSDDGGTSAIEDVGGPGTSEPYMRFSDFKAYMEATLDAIDQKIEALGSDFSTFCTTLDAANLTTTMLGPQKNAGIISACIEPTAGFDGEGSTISDRKDEMDPIKSTRVFGE